MKEINFEKLLEKMGDPELRVVVVDESFLQ